MTSKTNRRFIYFGIFALLCVIPTQFLARAWIEKLSARSGIDQNEYSGLFDLMIGIPAIMGFVSLVYLGIFPRVIKIFEKHRLYNTTGYLKDYEPEPEKEQGAYLSTGYNRKMERTMLKFTHRIGLAIVDEDKK